MLRRLLPGLAATALAALVLTGCATGGARDSGATPDDPSGSAEAENSGFRADAAWLAGGSLIAVVTYGSSTPDCRPGVDDAVLDDGVLVVTLTDPTGTDCDSDVGPQALAVGAPAGIDPAAGLDVQVLLGRDVADTSLAPYRGGDVEEYAPSAGWVGDDAIAILTWGSSSCAPTIESATVVSPTEVAVSFTPPRADQVCTMDMAPRVAVATLDGDVERDATVTLGGLSGGPGDGGAGAPLPIG